MTAEINLEAPYNKRGCCVRGRTRPRIRGLGKRRLVILTVPPNKQIVTPNWLLVFLYYYQLV